MQTGGTIVGSERKGISIEREGCAGNAPRRRTAEDTEPVGVFLVSREIVVTEHDILHHPLPVGCEKLHHRPAVVQARENQPAPFQTVEGDLLVFSGNSERMFRDVHGKGTFFCGKGTRKSAVPYVKDRWSARSAATSRPPGRCR
jgi:hypothetical protein